MIVSASEPTEYLRLGSVPLALSALATAGAVLALCAISRVSRPCWKTIYRGVAFIALLFAIGVALADLLGVLQLLDRLTADAPFPDAAIFTDDQFASTMAMLFPLAGLASLMLTPKRQRLRATPTAYLLFLLAIGGAVAAAAAANAVLFFIGLETVVLADQLQTWRTLHGAHRRKAWEGSNLHSLMISLAIFVALGAVAGCTRALSWSTIGGHLELVPHGSVEWHIATVAGLAIVACCCIRAWAGMTDVLGQSTGRHAVLFNILVMRTAPLAACVRLWLAMPTNVCRPIVVPVAGACVLVAGFALWKCFRSPGADGATRSWSLLQMAMVGVTVASYALLFDAAPAMLAARLTLLSMGTMIAWTAAVDLLGRRQTAGDVSGYWESLAGLARLRGATYRVLVAGLLSPAAAMIGVAIVLVAMPMLGMREAADRQLNVAAWCIVTTGGALLASVGWLTVRMMRLFRRMPLSTVPLNADEAGRRHRIALIVLGIVLALASLL